jgi:RND family efflux transporter MFP subunit
LTITRSENASALKRAQIQLEVAELELTRYMEGEYDKSRTSIEIAIQQAEMDLNQKQVELEKSRKLLEKQFISQSEVDELEDAVEKAKMTVRLHKLERDILQNYELPKNKMQRESDVEQAREELDREKQRAVSRERQAEARVSDQEQTLAIRSRRFERLRGQLDKCEIHAPVDGIVQYGEAGNRHRWWSGQRIAVGERVHEGQTVITLPDTRKMMVSTRIHEADRHMVSEGLVCNVRIPAVPGRAFTGKLRQIAQFADSEDRWLNPDLKEHEAEILLDETDEHVSPGDTAHVEILIEQAAEVLAIPVQCVFARGPKRYAFVQRGGSAEPVEIKVDRSSTTLIEVTDGLAAGDRVLMAPDEQMLARLPGVGTESAEQPEEGEKTAAAVVATP